MGLPRASTPQGLDVRTHARAIQIGAGLVTVLTAVWLLARLPAVAGGRRLALIAIYGAQIVIATGGLVLARRHMSLTGLRALAWLVGASVITSSVAISLWVDAGSAWETTLWIQVVLMGSAGLLPWSYRWQAVLSVLALAGCVSLIFNGTGHLALLPLADRLRLTGALAVTAGFSVLVAAMQDRYRRRLSATLDERSRSQALETLSAGIAHQFNNILGGILTNAQLLREDPDGGAADARLDQILDGVRRGRTLTKALQRFTPHATVTLKALDPATVVEDAATLIRASLPHTVSFEARALPGLPHIAGDADHLVHGCLELALNAFHACADRPGPRILLTATPSATGVRFAVEDNGCGMSNAARASALAPLSRSEPTWLQSGLGLASVRWVADVHRGTLTIDSTLGVGTTVAIELPALASQPAPVVPARRGRQVLVVDDDEMIRNPMRRVLERLDWTVREAADGPAAIAALRAAAGDVDLIILDIVLPGGGVGLLRSLLEIRPGARVLIASGFGPEGEAAKMLAAGAHGFIQKPFEIAELKAAIEQVV